MAKIDDLKAELKLIDDSILIFHDSCGGRIRTKTPKSFDVRGIGYSGWSNEPNIVPCSAVDGVIEASGWNKERRLLKQQIKEIEEAPPLFTYNYPSKFGNFTLDYTIVNGVPSISSFEAENRFQEWLREKESQVTPEPITAPTPEPTPEPIPIETPLVTEPEPVIIEQPYVTATPITMPTVDDSINTGMVTQQVINFNIVNGRAVGSIKFVATNNFNSYYYGKDIINMVQFKTPNGVTLLVKENRLRFTQTERDEIIHYDESVQENTRITVESFVWEWIDKPAGAFSNKYIIDISEAEPPKPMQTGFMGAGVAGAIAGLILLGSLIDLRGKK